MAPPETPNASLTPRPASIWTNADTTVVGSATPEGGTVLRPVCVTVIARIPRTYATMDAPGAVGRPDAALRRRGPIRQSTDEGRRRFQTNGLRPASEAGQVDCPRVSPLLGSERLNYVDT